MNDRGSFNIRAGQMSLFDSERHDAFTAGNFAKSLAGFFDARLSTPD